MVTFAQGSLGFMCNFTFDDHEEILGNIFESAKANSTSDFIGLEHRLRLKINMGKDTTKTRSIFRGD